MRVISLASLLIVATIIIYLLIVGKALIIPFVIAIAIWYLINSLEHNISRIKIKDKSLPSWFRKALSTIIIISILFFVVRLITVNANAMLKTAPEYKVNIDRILVRATGVLGLEETPDISKYIDDVDFTPYVSRLINMLSGAIGNILLVLVYVMFLLLEQRFFKSKLDALFPNNDQLSKANKILERIQRAVEVYISVKTFTSGLTATLSYVILLIAGVDFAFFWAFLIFLLNFIPTIGSLIATAFPALLALVQFDTFRPFIIVLVGVGIVQIIVGNFLEPRMMGNTLNISPLIVILSLSIWGVIWGIPGMFLCVPLTVMLIIILAQFSQTRPIAILLSGNGDVLSDE